MEGFSTSLKDIELSQMSAIGSEVKCQENRVIRYPKKETSSCNELVFRDLERTQTSNLLSRNQVHYSIMLRGPFLFFIRSCKNHNPFL